MMQSTMGLWQRHCHVHWEWTDRHALHHVWAMQQQTGVRCPQQLKICELPPQCYRVVPH
jgi:hypothetical protein